jgi:hypothetical protein
MTLPAAFIVRRARTGGGGGGKLWHDSLACLSDKAHCFLLFLACMNFLGAFFGRDICIRPRACKMAGYLFVLIVVCFFLFLILLRLCISATPLRLFTITMDG